MKSVLCAAAIAAASLTMTPAFAQGTPQTLMKLDVSAVATGYRASKIIGADIVNDANDKIGNVDDLIVNRSDRVPYAIVSVGGFLGVGSKLVAVPMANLQFSPDKTVLQGADKDMLKALPEFKYAK